MNKILRLYLSILLFGTLANAILIFGFLKTLNFGYKSAVSVYIYSIPGYFLKSLIFSTIIFLLHKKRFLENKSTRNMILWTPLILFILWYTLIIIFKIESLYVDLSFGYTSRFPHFYIQLLTCIIITISSLSIVRRTIITPDQNQLTDRTSIIKMLKIIATSVIFIIIGYKSIFWFQKNKLEIFCNEHSEFNLKKWSKNEKARYCMLDDIIAKEMFVNNTEEELTEILGKPFTSDKFFETKYLKFRTAQKSGQYMHWYLTVELKDNIVIRVRKSVN